MFLSFYQTCNHQYLMAPHFVPNSAAGKHLHKYISDIKPNQFDHKSVYNPFHNDLYQNPQVLLEHCKIRHLTTAPKMLLLVYSQPLLFQ